ncbi:helix-turn-helix domain-containing protein [Serratia fonticola]|uniref:helix-turn-helix domain-containing protein n=1 Tax=Serratia fonticola TaxID=47917 RepID=UPI003AF36841
MIYIVTKNVYLRLGVTQLLGNSKYYIDVSESNYLIFIEKLKASDVVVYHIDKTDNQWVSEMLSISYRAKVILFTSSCHLKISAINNIIAVIDEKTSLESIASIIRENHSCEIPSRVNKLNISKREHYILVKTVRGMSPCSIAKLLNISVKTVYGHRSSAYGKLGARTIHDIFKINSKHFR